jgi:DNA primase
MTIPPRFLDEIRNRLTLSDIIGRRTSVKRAGREFKACCPFHHEKTPSFTINDDKQFFHCFGCGAHGDVIGFVMRHDNLSFIDAVEMLSAEAGLQMPKPDPEMVKKAEKAKSLHTLMDAATTWFETQLNKQGNEKILAYLTDRGLKKETIAAFRVGFAPESGQEIRKFLSLQGYTDAQMIEAGVLKKSDKSKEPYAFFRDRIIFPVSDRRGRVVAFGGRILPDHMRAPDRGDFKPPKYINSSDTPLFDKGRMLYGESRARQAATEDLPVIVTEGYMDVIAAHQSGFRGAVAPMGTALTEDQILSLWSMIPAREKVPVLCFDGDEAGRRAASRACERLLPLLKPGQSARFAFMPDGEDPDTLLRAKGAPAFQNVIDGALPLFDFIWASHTAGRTFATPESQAGVVKDLQDNVLRIADRDVQRHYQQLVRERVSETFFRRRGGRGQNRPQEVPSALKIRRPAFGPEGIQARIILAAIINHPHIYPGIEEFLGVYDIQNKGLNQMRQAMVGALEEDSSLDCAALRNHLNHNGFSQEMDDILSESVYVHAAFTRPGADPGTVESKLTAWLGEVQGRDWKEINSGWKKAFDSSSEDEEEKLRHMVKIKATDRG